MELKGEIDKFTVLLGGFCTPLSGTEDSSNNRKKKQKVAQKIWTFSFINVSQLKLYSMEYTLFSSTEVTFTKMKLNLKKS